MAANSLSREETPSPQPPPSKRLKFNPSAAESTLLSPSSKGKTPIDYSNADGYESNHQDRGGDSDGGLSTMDDRPAQNCGICFSEEGEAVRGCIDSCDHYFCFLCIIEWSKIESRCPLCKRRFSAIRRMRRDGSLIGNCAVTVPIRDQVTGSDTVDPYANIACSVCHESSDECLLLLCDLCDSAMHSYCADLGFTVPEGEWFCKECTLMKTEESNVGSSSSDLAIPSCTPCNNNANIPPPSSPQSSPPSPQSSSVPAEVSLLDMVRDPQPRDTFNQDLVSRDHEGQSNLRVIDLVRQKDISIRTLRSCRSTHGRIRALRENWNAFRSGLVSFSSGPTTTSGDSIVQSNLRKRNGAVLNNTDAPQSSPSDSLEHNKRVEEQCDPSSNAANSVVQKKCSHDVDKAWKMLNLAKSMKYPPGKMMTNANVCSSVKRQSVNKSFLVKDKGVSGADVASAASRSLPSRGKDRFSSKLGIIQEDPTYGNKQIKSYAGLLRPERPSCSRDLGTFNGRFVSAPSPGGCTNLLSFKNAYNCVQPFCGDRSSMMIYQSGGDGNRTSTGAPRKKRIMQEESTSRYKQTIGYGLLRPEQPSCSNSRADSAGESTDLVSPKKAKNAHNSIQGGTFFSGDRNSMLNYQSKGDKTGISAGSPRKKDAVSAGFDRGSVHVKALPLVREENHPDGGAHQRKHYMDGSCKSQNSVEGCKREKTLEGCKSQKSLEGCKSQKSLEGCKREKTHLRDNGRVICQESKRSVKLSDAKSEIVSLVKLNLKLLTNKDRRLGVDMFKEIARRSTHSILGACGLEHHTSGAAVQVPSPPCPHHPDKTVVEQQSINSSLMPNCCRGCFYALVKEVVSSVMSETLKL